MIYCVIFEIAVNISALLHSLEDGSALSDRSGGVRCCCVRGASGSFVF